MATTPAGKITCPVCGTPSRVEGFGREGNRTQGRWIGPVYAESARSRARAAALRASNRR